MLLLATPAAAADCPADLAVTARSPFVWDGDTIGAGRHALRLIGMAAPEMDEAGGEAAREYMIGLVEGAEVRCVLDGTSAGWGRCAATCWLDDGRDIAAAIIGAGLARACTRFEERASLRYEEIQPAASRELPFPSYCEPR